MYSWKINNLYYKYKDTGFTFSPHPKIKDMYYLVYPDKVKSADFYSLDRVMSHCMDEHERTVLNVTNPED